MKSLFDLLRFPESGTLRSEALKNLLWKGAGEALPRLFTFVMTAIVARLLQPADFGRFSVGWSAAFAVASIIDFGWNAVLVRRLPEGRTDLIGSAFWLKIGAAALVIGSAAIHGAPANARLHETVYAALLIIAATFGMQDFMGAVSVGEQRLPREIVAKTVPRFFILAGLLVLIHRAPALPELVYTLALMSAGGVAVVSVWFFWNTRLRWDTALRDRMRGLVREGWRFGVISVLWTLYLRQDVLALGARNVETHVIGAYASAARLLDFGRMMPLSVQLVATPLLVKIASDNVRFASAIRKGCLVMAAAGALLVVVTWGVGPWAVKLVFGPAFGEAWKPLLVGTVGLSVSFINAPVVAALVVRFRESELVATYAIELVAALTFNLLMAPRLGAVTPAAGYLLAETLGLMTNLFILKRASRSYAGQPGS